MSRRSMQNGFVLQALRVLLVLALQTISKDTTQAAEKRTPDLEMGARLVESRCTFCHKDKALSELIDRCMAQQGETYLDNFLKRHHAPDDGARADIIAFLTCPPERLPKQ